MNDDDRPYASPIMDVLGTLAELQTQTAPIRITIGGTRNNIVNSDVVLIHDAPPRVVETLVRKFFGVSLHDGALQVPVKSFGQG